MQFIPFSSPKLSNTCCYEGFILIEYMAKVELLLQVQRFLSEPYGVGLIVALEEKFHVYLL